MNNPYFDKVVFATSALVMKIAVDNPGLPLSQEALTNLWRIHSSGFSRSAPP